MLGFCAESEQCRLYEDLMVWLPAFVFCQWMTDMARVILSCSLNYVTSCSTGLLKVFLSFHFSSPSFRPFHVEPTNIVSASDDMQRVSDEASAMNKRIHYYSRLTSPSDKALVRQRQGQMNWVLGLPQPWYIKEVQTMVGGKLICSFLWSRYLVAEYLNKVSCYHKSRSKSSVFTI